MLNTNTFFENLKEYHPPLCHEFNRDEKMNAIFELVTKIYKCVYDSLIEANNISNGAKEKIFCLERFGSEAQKRF